MKKKSNLVEGKDYYFNHNGKKIRIRPKMTKKKSRVGKYCLRCGVTRYQARIGFVCNSWGTNYPKHLWKPNFKKGATNGR